MSVPTRRRLLAALAVLTVLLLIAFVAVPALPCGAPGGSVCPASDEAIALVPDDALAYVHINADSSTDQYRQASDIAGRIPTLSAQVTGRLLAILPGPHGAPPDFGRQIGPWFGGQAALAVVPAGGRASDDIELLQVSDADGARKFARSLAGAIRTRSYHGVPVSVDRRGLATAIVDGFLVMGGKAGVHAVIDARSGASAGGSLADDPSAAAARDALPDQRLADAYLSPDGVARLVANPRGPLSTLDATLDPAATEGAAFAVVASEDGLEVAVRSKLDPQRASAQPSFFAAFPGFTPALIGSLPADSLAYVGMGDPRGALASLVRQARTSQPGLAAAVAALARRVKQLSGVSAPLSDSQAFEQATDGLPSPGSMLAYLNLDGLVALGESAGLARDPAYRTFAPEVHRLSAAGDSVDRSQAELATDFRLIVGAAGSAPSG